MDIHICRSKGVAFSRVNIGFLKPTNTWYAIVRVIMSLPADDEDERVYLSSGMAARLGETCST